MNKFFMLYVVLVILAGYDDYSRTGDVAEVLHQMVPFILLPIAIYCLAMARHIRRADPVIWERNRRALKTVKRYNKSPDSSSLPPDLVAEGTIKTGLIFRGGKPVRTASVSDEKLFESFR